MATKTYPFGRNKEQLAASFGNNLKVTYPENIEIDKDLIDLMNHLITLTSEERYSWDEFFNHCYVKRAMNKIKTSMPFLNN